jgi:hypothetical protein
LPGSYAVHIVRLQNRKEHHDRHRSRTGVIVLLVIGAVLVIVGGEYHAGTARVFSQTN